MKLSTWQYYRTVRTLSQFQPMLVQPRDTEELMLRLCRSPSIHLRCSILPSFSSSRPHSSSNKHIRTQAFQVLHPTSIYRLSNRDNMLVVASMEAVETCITFLLQKTGHHSRNSSSRISICHHSLIATLILKLGVKIALQQLIAVELLVLVPI